MDLTYRTDLRQLNETNFARFDAKLEQRLAALEGRFVALEARFDKQDAVIDARFARQEASLAKLSESLQATTLSEFQRQTRWMVGLWMTTMVTIIVSVVTLLVRS